MAILCALGAVAGAAPVARQQEWRVSSLKANITVNSDSSLLVDETLVIPEGQDPNFGLRCAIPIGDNDRWDRNYNPGYTDDNGLRVKVQRVAVDGAPVEFRLDHYLRHGYQVIVRNGSLMNADGQGTHELNVIYRVTGAMRPVGSDDELYWNAAGNMLSIAYDSMSVRVSLPAGVPGDSVQVTSYGGGRGRSVGPIGTDAGIETTILARWRGVQFHEFAAAREFVDCDSLAAGICPQADWACSLRDALLPGAAAAARHLPVGEGVLAAEC